MAKSLRGRLADLEAAFADAMPPAPVVVWHCKTDRVTNEDRRGAAERAAFIGAPGARVIFCTTHDGRRLDLHPEPQPTHGTAEHPLLGRLRALPADERRNALTELVLNGRVTFDEAEHLHAALAARELAVE